MHNNIPPSHLHKMSRTFLHTHLGVSSDREHKQVGTRALHSTPVNSYFARLDEGIVRKVNAYYYNDFALLHWFYSGRLVHANTDASDGGSSVLPVRVLLTVLVV
jgi:phage terminase large subunit